jgi:uncharacterized protein (DUF1697 family)
MAVHIALLRAVNVGGRSVPMADLREMLVDLGLDDVRTVLQSGNAVFQSSKSPDALETLLEKTAARRFGIAIEFFVRTARQWDAAIAANPFVAEARDDPSHMILMALKKAPKGAELERLTSDIKGRERVAAEGRHAYLVYPDGIGRSKMTNAFIESRLATRGSGRSWHTVLKLAGFARGA